MYTEAQQLSNEDHVRVSALREGYVAIGGFPSYKDSDIFLIYIQVATRVQAGQSNSPQSGTI